MSPRSSANNNNSSRCTKTKQRKQALTSTTLTSTTSSTQANNNTTATAAAQSRLSRRSSTSTTAGKKSLHLLGGSQSSVSAASPRKRIQKGLEQGKKPALLPVSGGSVSKRKRASKKRKSEHISESIENRPVKTMKRESEASRDTAAEESSLHLPETPTDMGASETPDARPGRGSSRIDMGALGTFLRGIGSSSDDVDKDTGGRGDGPEGEGGDGMSAMGVASSSSSSSAFPEGLAFLMSAASSGGAMQRIVADLKSDDSLRVIASLTELNDLLNMSGEEISIGFPIETTVPLLVKHVERDDPQDEGDDPDTRRLLATRCIYSLLDILPAATARLLANSGTGLETLCDKLRNITNIDLAEQCIRILYRLSSEQPTALFCAGGVEALLQCMDFFTTYCQDQALSAVKNMVRMARVNPEKWEEYLVEPPCCLNQLVAVLGHADSSMQARAAETWKGMLSNLTRVYATSSSSSSSPVSSTSSSPRIVSASSSSTMGKILGRFRSSSRVMSAADQSGGRLDDSARTEVTVSSKALSRGAEKLMGEGGDRLKKIVERAQEELDHPSSARTSSGVVTDLLACIASVVACSDELAAVAMQEGSMEQLLEKLLTPDGEVAEEMSRQALKTATALLPAVKLNPPKAGQKKIDVYKILRLSGESSRSTTAKSSSAEYTGRNVPRDLLVKLIRGAVGSASADQQNSMQLLVSASIYARQRGWDLTATHPELIDRAFSYLADVMDQQCSASRYSPSLLLACLHTILTLTPKGKGVLMTQDLAQRHGIIKLLREIEGWKEPAEVSAAESGTLEVGSQEGVPPPARSSSILGSLRRSSRRDSLSPAVEASADAQSTSGQETTLGWLPLLQAEAGQALRVLNREKGSSGVGSRQLLTRSGEMNLEVFTAFAGSPSLPTPYELLQSGMLEKMCDFVARGHDADAVGKVLSANPEFYEHIVKCLVSAIDRHRLLGLALNPVPDGGIALPSTMGSKQRGSIGNLGLQLIGKPIRLKLEGRKKEGDGAEKKDSCQSSSSSSMAADSMGTRLRRALSFRSREGLENSPRGGLGGNDMASLMPPSLMVTVEPLATVGAVCGYILQRVKVFRRCMGPGEGGCSREFIEELLLGEDDDEDEDEEAFLMGLHGDDMEMDEEDYDDEDMMLDEEDECHQAGEESEGEHEDDDMIARGSREADEEAFKRMMAEACRGRGRSRRGSNEDVFRGRGEEHDSPRSAARGGRGDRRAAKPESAPAKAPPPPEPTGVVLYLDGHPIPNHVTVVQAVWLAASRAAVASGVPSDESMGVTSRPPARLVRSARPPSEKPSRFVIAADDTDERVAEEEMDEANGKSTDGAKASISSVISTIWGTAHSLDFELTFAKGDEEATKSNRAPSPGVMSPHEPRAVVCDRPLAVEERVKAAAEAVEGHFGQLEGQNWDGLDRLVELLVSLAKLRPKDSPVRWSTFACGALSKRQLAVASSPLSLITNIPADFKVLMGGKKDDDDDASVRHTRLVSVAPVLFDTETRRRVMASSCFGLHRALQGISEQAATDAPNSSPSAQQMTALPRQKVRIRREKLLESAVLVMNVFGAGKEKASAALEVEFLGEVGTGSGPTNEFYACVAEELKKVPSFSRESESRLFPMPVSEEDGCNAEAYRKVLASAAEQRENPPKTTPERNGQSPSHRGRSNSELSDISEDVGDVTANIGIASPTPSPSLKDGGEDAKEGSSNREGMTVESKAKSIPSVLEAWRLAGHIVARCILDSRLVDLDIHPVMWELVKEILASEEAREVEVPCVYYLSLVDPALHRTLLSLTRMSPGELRSLEISATKVPGYENITLPGLRGNVSSKNVDKFVEGVATAVTYSGVYWQLRAFADAFAEILSPAALSLWRSEDELTELTYGSSAARPEYWTKEHLLSSIQPKHGYTSTSPAVQYLVDVMATDLTPEQRQQLVRFLTGSPTLPIGGFAALKPQLTVVRQVLDDESANPDDFLPSVMTCASFMKLPDYSSKEVLKRQLVKAISEGQKAFLMS